MRSTSAPPQLAGVRTLPGSLDQLCITGAVITSPDASAYSSTADHIMSSVMDTAECSSPVTQTPSPRYLSLTILYRFGITTVPG